MCQLEKILWKITLVKVKTQLFTLQQIYIANFFAMQRLFNLLGFSLVVLDIKAVFFLENSTKVQLKWNEKFCVINSVRWKYDKVQWKIPSSYEKGLHHYKPSQGIYSIKSFLPFQICIMWSLNFAIAINLVIISCTTWSLQFQVYFYILILFIGRSLRILTILLKSMNIHLCNYVVSINKLCKLLTFLQQQISAVLSFN